MTDPRKALLNLKKREEERLKELALEKGRIIELLKANTAFFRCRGIVRVVLFGSIAGTTFDSQSDVDLAVEPFQEYDELFNLGVELEELLGRKVDISNLDELPFKESLKEKGEIIYEE